MYCRKALVENYATLRGITCRNRVSASARRRATVYLSTRNPVSIDFCKVTAAEAVRATWIDPETRRRVKDSFARVATNLRRESLACVEQSIEIRYFYVEFAFIGGASRL
jgi:hypothetical protein